MLEEVGKFLLTDVLGESLAGLLQSGRTPKGRRFKVFGRFCVIASIASFGLAVWLPSLIGLELSLIAGLLAGAAAVGSGFWALAAEACGESGES